MSLTKETVIDQITITDIGLVMLREVTRIMENDVEISKQYHRTCIQKNDDVSNQPLNVQNICKTAWKEEL